METQRGEREGKEWKTCSYTRKQRGENRLMCQSYYPFWFIIFCKSVAAYHNLHISTLFSVFSTFFFYLYFQTHLPLYYFKFKRFRFFHSFVVFYSPSFSIHQSRGNVGNARRWKRIPFRTCCTSVQFANISSTIPVNRWTRHWTEGSPNIRIECKKKIEKEKKEEEEKLHTVIKGGAARRNAIIPFWNLKSDRARCALRVHERECVHEQFRSLWLSQIASNHR